MGLSKKSIFQLILYNKIFVVLCNFSVNICVTALYIASQRYTSKGIPVAKVDTEVHRGLFRQPRGQGLNS